jgi:hypothetical protein
VIKKEAEKILQFKDLTIETAHVECKIKVTQMTTEQLQNDPGSTSATYQESTTSRNHRK